MDFDQFIFGALIFSLSLSLILLDTQIFLEHSQRSVAYVAFGVRRQRKIMKVQEDIRISNYNKFCLQVLSCMYDFLASFGMHGICRWLFGYDMSLAWRIPQIDNGFSQPCHFLDSHGVVGFTFVLWLVFLFLWMWVELLVLGLMKRPKLLKNLKRLYVLLPHWPHLTSQNLHCGV